MPSNRRVRAVLICGIVAIIITLYVSSSASSTRSSPFYTSTRDALSQRQAEEAHGAALESDDSAVQARLREAEEKAKKAADKKGDEFHSEEFKSKAAKVKAEVDMSRASGDGGVAKKDGSIRKDFRGGSEKVLMEAEGKAEKERQKEKEESEKSPEERKAEAELNYILKRSPIIIFSKSYCPYSKKAKNILLTKYDITPPPHVVELDLHEIGHELQGQLKKSTGRGTVPNVLINGKSIGGGDDIEELHLSGGLISKIQSLGGKRVTISKHEGRS